MYWHGYFHLLWMTLFWIGGATAAVIGLRYALQGPTGEADPAPKERLKQRYLRGEIDRDEYKERLRHLRD